MQQPELDNVQFAYGVPVLAGHAQKTRHVLLRRGDHLSWTHKRRTVWQLALIFVEPSLTVTYSALTALGVLNKVVGERPMKAEKGFDLHAVRRKLI
eukprot:4419243-Amphidinium_carterae.1